MEMEPTPTSAAVDASAAADAQTAVDVAVPPAVQPKPKRKRPASASAAESKSRRGVVYISRVPPYMKPEKLRHLLGQYGELGRVFLVPEDQAQHRKRVAAGGNRKTKYTEGWVEFADKKVARNVAALLNTKQIGGRKRDFYHDDMWNLKYLKGFKWEHLTEKMAYENRIRAQKLRMEIAQAKKENDVYLERVEQSKRLAQMEKRKAGKDSHEPQQVRRVFAQKAPTDARQPTASTHAGGADGDVLAKVFGASKKRKVDA